MNINTVLIKLGITANYKGFHFLKAAIQLYKNDNTCLTLITRSVYAILARKFQTTTACVERNIRTIITIAWNYGNHHFLTEIFGYTLVDKPSSAVFIAALSVYCEQFND